MGKTRIGTIAGIILSFIFLANVGGGEEVKTFCKKEYHTERGQSPWQNYTRDYKEEQAGKTISAVKITDEMERVPHLASYSMDGKPLLAIDRAHQRVVVNESFFGELKRPDVTRMRAGESVAVGKIIEPKLLEDPGFLVSFLIESQLIETYQHLEATIKLKGEKNTPESFVAGFEGTHIYFTNDRNEDPIRFNVTIDKKTGEILVLGE